MADNLCTRPGNYSIKSRAGYNVACTVLGIYNFALAQPGWHCIISMSYDNKDVCFSGLLVLLAITKQPTTDT